MAGCDQCESLWLFPGCQARCQSDEGPAPGHHHPGQLQVGKKGSYKNSAYAASSLADGLTQSIALELAEYGVRVNSVCPGNLLDSPLWWIPLYKQYAKKWASPKPSSAEIH